MTFNLQPLRIIDIGWLRLRYLTEIPANLDPTSPSTCRTCTSGGCFMQLCTSACEWMVACSYTHRHPRMHSAEEVVDWLDTWTRYSCSFGHCTLPLGFYATYMQGVHIYTYPLLLSMSRQIPMLFVSLYIYTYIIYPELRIENCRFGSGKGAGPL